MGVSTFKQEFASSVAPSRMFKALILDSNILIPQLLPQFVQSIDVIQGDDGIATIEQVNFTEGNEFKFIKNKIEELDKDNLMCKYTLIEGGPLGDKLKSIDHEVKFEAAGNGGSVCKIRSNYISDGDFTYKEEDIKDGEAKTLGVFKVVESYLLDNPHVYA